MLWGECLVNKSCSYQWGSLHFSLSEWMCRGRNYGRGIFNSLQIFWAVILLISVCRGTEAWVRCSEFRHIECLPPSRRSTHPWSLRCLINFLRFIHQFLPPQIRFQFDAMFPAYRTLRCQMLLKPQLHFQSGARLPAFHILIFHEV